MAISWIDLLLILIIALSMASGWHRGFILSSLDLARWIISWVAALLFYKPVADWLGHITDWTETWRMPAAFLIILLTVGILFQMGGRAILRRIEKEYHQHKINRWLGLVPGVVTGFVMAALISALLFSLPISDGFSRSVQESTLANRFASYTDDLESVLSPIFEPAVRRGLNRFTTIQPGSDAFVELPFKVENTKPLPVLEAEMLEMVNKERIAHGLKPVEADPEMTEVARRHSADMFARGYFSHYTPERKDPFDRMRDMDVRFRAAGENLALAPTLEIAHTGLMNSPGHRANILQPRFGRLGIGIMDGGRRGLMITQKFRN
jgi:uncharacterized protein YkwD/uncharacterized membrane protein required for colicin V production